jgi:hypothetical protein
MFYNSVRIHKSLRITRDGGRSERSRLVAGRDSLAGFLGN